MEYKILLSSVCYLILNVLSVYNFRSEMMTLALILLCIKYVFHSICLSGKVNFSSPIYEGKHNHRDKEEQSVHFFLITWCTFIFRLRACVPMTILEPESLICPSTTLWYESMERKKSENPVHIQEIFLFI